VIWAGNLDLRAFSGKPARLHFQLKHADLYSFGFKTRPE
jgi:hypothetical protein